MNIEKQKDNLIAKWQHGEYTEVEIREILTNEYSATEMAVISEEIQAIKYQALERQIQLWRAKQVTLGGLQWFVKRAFREDEQEEVVNLIKQLEQ